MQGVDTLGLEPVRADIVSLVMTLQKTLSFLATATALVAVPSLASAQDIEALPATTDAMLEGSVFDDTHITIGVGAAISPSYTGSNDYVVSGLPIIFGSVRGVDINVRPAGLALDFIEDGEKVGFDLGPAFRLRSDRNNQIADDVVESLGELDRAIEVGPSVGIRIPQIIHSFDALSVTTDVLWDVNGAHGGMVVAPSVTYFSPLSLGVAASLSVNAEFADSDFHDYYFSVSPAQEIATAGAVTAFDPDGGGLVSLGSTLLLGVDLDGDVRNGGWGVVTILGYSRVMGDAKRTPLTSQRGSADQGFLALGVGYTF